MTLVKKCAKYGLDRDPNLDADLDSERAETFPKLEREPN